MKAVFPGLRGSVLCFLLLPAAAAVADDARSDSGFVSMFDGKTLSGWEVTPADAQQAWSVSDGMIVGKGAAGRSYLVYENHDIADFELKLSYRFPGDGNSGISIRARKDPTGRRGFQSYHADLGHVGIGKHILGAWDFHTPGRTEHGCHRGKRLVIDSNDRAEFTAIEDPLTLQDVRRGEWNDVHVIARGNRFTFRINGRLSSEFTEHLPSARRLERGMIQLQLHDPGMVVHFRDVRIRILD